MHGYIIRRVLYACISLVLLSITIFLLVRITGDPAVAMAISLILGIPIGILSAVRVNTWLDKFGGIFAILGLSLPSFWVGLMLILVLSVELGWLPSSGFDSWKHIIMPAFSLGWVFAAAHMRLARSAMLEVLGSEYIKLARIKGLSERLVIV